ncbi:MAG TPA: ParB/RepB/Spo0J family partition protein, partial [Prosthecobacter sp.]|nr:ParB/RepB/Spo0J family partition protein [Prosthecobacter sp.]
ELVAGERRLRAARLAGLETVPVIVYELDERAAQEIVLIENLQREDLTVTEEARGYEAALALRDDAGRPVYTQESLAAKLGKKVGYIRDRLKLLLCPELLITAVEAGEVALSTAMLVGRIPGDKERVEAAKKVLSPTRQDVPLNYEQTREMIREEFMVSLQKPGFDLEDAELVPVRVDDDGSRIFGGACVGCPFAVKQEHALQMESPKNGAKIVSGSGTMLCTLPSCFKKKQDAAWRIIARQAEAAGSRVLEGDAAAKVFNTWNGEVTDSAPYVALDEAPGYTDLGMLSYENKKKWRSLLKGAELEVVVARHPKTGRRVELVERKPAQQIVRAKLKGGGAAADVKDLAQAEAARKEQRAEDLRKAKLEKITLHECVGDVLASVGRKGVGVEEGCLLFQMALDNGGADGMKFFKEWLGLKLPKGTARSGRDYEESILEAVRARAVSVNDWLGFIVVAVIARGLAWQGCDNEDLELLMERYGVKKKEVARRAQALLDAGKKAPKGKRLDKADSDDRDDGVEVKPDLDLLERCRVWRAENPGRGAAALADALGLSYDEACRCVDALIDEAAPAEDPAAASADEGGGDEAADVAFKNQVRWIAEGSAKVGDYIGVKPKADEVEALAEWNRERMRYNRAVKKYKQRPDLLR